MQRAAHFKFGSCQGVSQFQEDQPGFAGHNLNCQKSSKNWIEIDRISKLIFVSDTKPRILLARTSILIDNPQKADMLLVSAFAVSSLRSSET